MRGELSAEQRDLFCGARLIPVSKKPSGIRPVAVGETLRLLAAKCLVEKYQAAVEYLEPLQLGVGVRGATEAIIHHVKEWMHSGVPADHALLLLDFSNARSAMLRAISERCPHFLPYARNLTPLRHLCSVLEAASARKPERSKGTSAVPCSLR